MNNKIETLLASKVNKIRHLCVKPSTEGKIFKFKGSENCSKTNVEIIIYMIW